METGKELARKALIRRINDFKPDESIGQVVEEIVEEIWNIFENERVELIVRGREKQCH